MTLPLIILILLGGLVVYAVAIYNYLVTTKTRIGASIQEIGNQLKRQANLIPNLEESAKSYLKHEKDIFAKLTDARKSIDTAVKSGDVAKMGAANDKVQALLSGLKVILESNPEIKGAQVIEKLMDELRDTADKLMYARRTFVDLTADFNIKLVTFPSNFVANMFGFKAEKGLETPAEGEHLEVSAEETKSPKVNLE